MEGVFHSYVMLIGEQKPPPLYPVKPSSGPGTASPVLHLPSSQWETSVKDVGKQGLFKSLFHQIQLNTCLCQHMKWNSFQK